MNAVEILRRRAAIIAAETQARIELGEDVPLVSLPGDGGITCAECGNMRTRKMQIGSTTITIGRPEFQCTIDSGYRSPELKRSCTRFVRGKRP